MKLASFSSNLACKKILPPLQERSDYSRLIVDHLPNIEKQCRKAAVSPGNSCSDIEIDNEADHLLTEVLDHLKANDYKVLRDFRGNSKLTTYLTAVISNLVIDLVRKRKGRSRARERAKDLGPVAYKLYELVYGRGYSLANAHGHLVLSHGISESEDDLRTMLDRIGGSNVVARAGTSDWPYQGLEVLAGDEIELVVPDPAKSAEDILIGTQRDSHREQAISVILEGLSGEERFMLRLRYPATEEEPRSVREIAIMLAQSEKAVDNRLRRILMRCRETLLSCGLSLDDLISVRE
jgi:RNA polymerase sigma factor (sigma-70 family)